MTPWALGLWEPKAPTRVGIRGGLAVGGGGYMRIRPLGTYMHVYPSRPYRPPLESEPRCIQIGEPHFFTLVVGGEG